MQFTIKPNWQPISTAPKDRPVWLYCRGIDYDTGKQRGYHRTAYWGRLLDYPNTEESWLPIGAGGNAQIPDDPHLTKRVSVYEDHGAVREIVSYIGTIITHWAEVIDHEVLVLSPAGENWPLPVQQVTNDMRVRPVVAQAIEAGTAETGTGSVHESAVGVADAS